ncbi:MAG: hypothetical protein GXO89_01235 [Chlorobi bacterium]|nr:hypothetical protein [Chlorobiota bacterium]
MKNSLCILLLLLLTVPGYKANAQGTDTKANTPVPFTLADRDRLLKLENSVKMLDVKIDATNQRISSLEKSINGHFDAQDKRFDAQDKRFDALQNQMNILFGFLFLILGGVMSLIAFVIYDRRIILRPLNQKQEEMETALIKFSRKNKDLREALQKAGIL